MKEDICKTCGAELKWVGSIMDGHVECPTCDGAKANYAGVSVDYATDDGVFYDDCEEVMCTPEPEEVMCTPEPEEVMCTPEPRADKLNFKEQFLDNNGFVETGRRTGKTYEMLRQAVGCMSDCYVVVHNHTMEHYCANILIDRFECKWLNRHKYRLCTPNRTHITIIRADRANTPGIIVRGWPVFFDHAVSFKQWEAVNGYL